MENLLNFAQSTLAAAVTTTGQTSWTVAAGEGARFGSTYPLRLVCGDEVISMTGRQTDVLTVARAPEGPTPATYAIGATVAQEITAGMLAQLKLDATTATETTITGATTLTSADFFTHVIC